MNDNKLSILLMAKGDHQIDWNVLIYCNSHVVQVELSAGTDGLCCYL